MGLDKQQAAQAAGAATNEAREESEHDKWVGFVEKTSRDGILSLTGHDVKVFKEHLQDPSKREIVIGNFLMEMSDQAISGRLGECKGMHHALMMMSEQAARFGIKQEELEAFMGNAVRKAISFAKE